MNEVRRELIMKVLDGDVRNLPILYEFDRFKHCDRMLQYLVKEKITGTKFHDMYLNVFKASWLTFGKWIVMKVNKDNEMKPLIGNKDFRLG